MALLAALGACAAPPARLADAPPPPKAALPFDDAVLALAEATLAGARTLPEIAAGGRRMLVIDPLIDRASGAETAATRGMEARIAALVRERHPEFDLQPFSLAALEAQPLILLGAMTPVEAPGSLANATAPTDTFRIWAVLGDLRSGTILAHPTAWVQGGTVDATPTAFFADSPAWTEDAMVAAYLRTCAGAPGTPMDPAYLRGLRAQALVAEGVAAQEAGRPERALALFRQAGTTAGGRQLRALNGIYLANQALGRETEAEQAFADLVEVGLEQERLAVKLLFRPATTEFVRDPRVSGPYPMWLRQIAERAEARRACLQVVGHASVTGGAAANDRLSLARAGRVRARLVAAEPPLRPRTAALGRGARDPIIGLGTDDMRDALDRRVEFRPQRCDQLVAAR
ncbi:OmpA family protein [Paracraurococcus ruber]|uniref:OmpA family protein n=1 Tax=Paracraurococcus ruber TaxID=77675 RepID=UPI0010578B76|nr:OmpA family protein [Paracraurococcus ruber]TDG32548.1 OmpA family protein [Paracraurococcus ruber]